MSEARAASSAVVYERQGIRVDPVARQVWRDGEPVAFSRKEFDLLLALISRAGEVVTREELLRDIWQYAPVAGTTSRGQTKTLDVHLGWVRRKLGDDTRHPHLITTLRGRGLRFELVPPVARAR